MAKSKNQDAIADPGALTCGCELGEPVSLAAWWRIAVCAVLAVNSMALSLAVDLATTTDIERLVIHSILGAAAVLALLLLGFRLVKNCVNELKERRITIEALFFAGIVAAFVASAVAASTGFGDVYFEIVIILLVVYSLGQQLTAQAQDRALRATMAWLPQSTMCRIVDPDGATREISVDQLEKGDLVLAVPGSSIAADGVVESGEAFVREAEMTGESFATVKGPGARVWAGTHCVDASLRVRATAAGGERRIDRIVQAVERARANPASIQSRVDGVVVWFLPTVVLIAALTFLWWTARSGWNVGLFHAMAVLLVACPCALGLATPLALWAALGRLASRGLLARGADSVEKLASVDTAVFDKTGTLTHSKASLVEVVVEPSEELDESAITSMVREVERIANHPIAAAFQELDEQKPSRFCVQATTLLPAVGITAEVFDTELEKTFRLSIGTADRLTESNGQDLRKLRTRLITKVEAKEILALIDGQPVLMARVSEQFRRSWQVAQDRLRELGLRTIVMTGDIEERARLSGADFLFAELSPEEKLKHVRTLQQQGRCLVFVGDGVNDAAALAASDVGIGLQSGTELASEVADLAWFGTDLKTVPWAISTAREAIATVRGNLRFALAYNVVGLVIAAAGWLHPVAATLLMTCSSLVVTWRSLTVLGDVQEERLTASGMTNIELEVRASG